MKKVLVFDLDDTLYNELSYVHSGFAAVAEFLQQNYSLDKDILLSQMIAAEKVARNGVFDRVLLNYPFYSKKLIAKCLSVYRSHSPKINLEESAKQCLSRLAAYPKYLVTDGNKLVQRMKVKQLGVQAYMEKIFVTHGYGRQYAKPSLYCFEKIRQLEGVEPEQVVYVGDNPHKDFINLKKAGYKTIRIINGSYSKITLAPEYEAEYIIHSLDEIDENLLKTVFK